MSDFRIWLESDSKKIGGIYRFTISGNTTAAIEDWLITHPSISGDSEQEELAQWMRRNLNVERSFGHSELSIDVRVRTLPLVKMLIEELRSYLVRHRSWGIQRIHDTIRQPYIRVASLYDIAMASDPKWQLFDAIDHNDLDKWLVYADHIEEMGDQKNSAIIRRVLR